jgi:cbb3-type cytochrome oxidase subunit 3
MGSAFPSPDTTLGGDIIDGMILIIAPFLPTIVLLAMVFMVLNKRKKKELAAKK